MEVIKTDIDGVVIIEPRIFRDERGYFFESFSQRDFQEKVCNTVSYRTTKASRATACFAVCTFRNRPMHSQNSSV